MSRLQVVTWAPGMTTPRYLGQYGHVSALNYSYACPGGSDQLTCTLWKGARFRADGMNPGRIVQVICGASVIWEGVMLEPAPSANGWAITAVGNGSWGTNFRAVYTPPWATTTADDIVNQAITRGLRWVNPGIGNPSGAWFGQAVDSAAQTVTDALNLICSNGGLTWYVGRGNVLSVFAIGANGLPASRPVRQMINPNPVARTLGGNLNRIYLRYEATADTTGAAATFAVTNADDPASISQFGTHMEDYADLSSAGVLTAGAAQQIGSFILDRYQRATYAGPFTVRQGQLLNFGGQPADIAQEQAGMVVRMLMTDYGYGGEEVPGPVQFLAGGYAYDDDSQTAQITPFQNLNASEQSITVEPWITAAPFTPPPPPPRRRRRTAA